MASHKVLDRSTLNDVYVPKAVDCLNKFDVEIPVVNETVEVVEGQTGHDRLVILRFPSREEALRWYHSPEYQSMINLRLDSVEGVLLLSEGLTPVDLATAQPMERPAAAASPSHTPAASMTPTVTNTVVQVAPAGNFRSGELTTSGFEGWSEQIKQEFRKPKIMVYRKE